MKTHLIALVAVLSATLLSGCSSMFGGNGADPAGEARAKQRELNALTHSGITPVDSSASSYPGGTTAAEWKSMTSPSPK